MIKWWYSKVRGLTGLALCQKIGHDFVPEYERTFTVTSPFCSSEVHDYLHVKYSRCVRCDQHQRLLWEGWTDQPIPMRKIT